MEKELFFDKVSPLYSFGYSVEISKPKGGHENLWRVTKDNEQVFIGNYNEYCSFFSKTINNCLENLLALS